MSQTLTCNMSFVDQSGNNIGSGQFTITVPPAPVATAPTPPAQAVAAGYTNLVFDDEFTSASTVATSGSATSGFKWYQSPAVGSMITSASWSVDTTGPGLLKLNSVRGSNTAGWGNSTLLTIPRGASTLPVSGAWQHGYFEAYFQLPTVLGSPTGAQANGWPAVWGWTFEGANSFWGGQFPALTAVSTEVDMMEAQSGVFGWPSPPASGGGHAESNVLQPGAGSAVFHQVLPLIADHNWHKIGLLWKPSALSIFYDDVQQGAVFNTSSTKLETSHMFLILGTGIGWPMNVDWVRVWQ